MLSRLGDIYSEDYTSRATELNMTMDQIITLASIIEKEAKVADFKKVSAIYHYRLQKGQKLEADPTVSYALGVKRLNLTKEELALDSPFNTHVNKGLPVGPICNPGKAAI